MQIKGRSKGMRSICKCVETVPANRDRLMSEQDIARSRKLLDAGMGDKQHMTILQQVADDLRGTLTIIEQLADEVANLREG